MSTTTTTIKPITGWHILVVDNGFIFVGDCVTGQGMTMLQHAKTLRRWGTTTGLGELVNGPTAKTVADPVGNILVPFPRVIFAIPVKEAAWRGK
jgi:hypothetical protein